MGWLKDSEGQVLTRVCVCAPADYCDAKPSPRLGETAEKHLHNQNQYNVFTFVFFFHSTFRNNIFNVPCNAL